MLTHVIFVSLFNIGRCPRNKEEDVDCDMAEIQLKDDDTDLDSFERDEQQMEEEAAKVNFLIISI